MRRDWAGTRVIIRRPASPIASGTPSQVTTDNSLPFTLEREELGLVYGKLGAEFEALGFLLRNEPEKVGVSGEVKSVQV
jgi:hypothetical protein